MEISRLREDLPIFKTMLPVEIIKEIDNWIYNCKEIKNHNLGYLKQHDNNGTNHNTYQVSIPKHNIEQGFFLAYLLKFCAECYGEKHRNYRLRYWPGHFDNYDIWANFTYEYDDNPLHTHGGDLSGVIYYQNDDTPTLFPDYNIGYSGTKNTMILFPADTKHKVESKISKCERITIAFNIVKTQYVGI